MKKGLLTGLILMVMSTQVWAWPGTVATKVFASWINVDSWNHYMYIPTKSKSIMIQNGSAYPVCVSLEGSATRPTTLIDICTPNDGDLFMLDADSEVYVENYMTDTIGFSKITSSASPINVIVTY